jgi:integrase/recombinase XerD
MRTGCRWCAGSLPTCTIDPAAEIPPAGLIPARPRRASPYLYSDAGIAALIAAAASLRSRLRTATCQTLIGLLAVTGRGSAR